MIKRILKKIAPFWMIENVNYLRRFRESERSAADIAQKNRSMIDSLLQGSVPIKLEMGAGCNRGIPGWTYIDTNGQCDLLMDLSQPLAFPDNSVDIIYSSHLLEHFTYPELMSFLAECLRILKPGGSFSAAVPNARIFLDSYHDPDRFNPAIYCPYKPAYHYNSKIDYVNYIAYMDGHHKYMFDEDNVLEVLRKTGYRNAKLRNADKELDLESRDFQSIYVEATK